MKKLLVVFLGLIVVASCHEPTDDSDSDCDSVTSGCDFDGDGMDNENDPEPENNTIADCEDLGFACGNTAAGFNCGECGLEKEYCVDNQCVDDCGELECGESPKGLNCGWCSGVSEYCSDGSCVDDCLEHECGQSPIQGAQCGQCGSEETPHCIGNKCVDDCDGLECGESPNVEADCGNCGEGNYCDDNQCKTPDDICPPYWGKYDAVNSLCWQHPKSIYTYLWEEAKDYCENLVLGGHSDWFLPSRQDFVDMLGGCDESVLEGESGYCNSCFESFTSCNNMFGSDGEHYWSSTHEGKPSSSSAWDVDFSSGFIYNHKSDWFHYTVRCVR